MYINKLFIIFSNKVKSKSLCKKKGIKTKPKKAASYYFKY